MPAFSRGDGENTVPNFSDDSVYIVIVFESPHEHRRIVRLGPLVQLICRKPHLFRNDLHPWQRSNTICSLSVAFQILSNGWTCACFKIPCHLMFLEVACLQSSLRHT
jgi:hypothetical protein